MKAIQFTLILILTAVLTFLVVFFYVPVGVKLYDAYMIEKNEKDEMKAVMEEIEAEEQRLEAEEVEKIKKRAEERAADNYKEATKKGDDASEEFVEMANEYVTALEDKVAQSKLIAVPDKDMVLMSDYTDIKEDNYFTHTPIFFDDEMGNTVHEIASKEPIRIKAGTLKKLVNADLYLRKAGYRLVVWVGYRSNELQKRLRNHLEYTENVTAGRYDLVAAPGQSRHQMGQAVDIYIENLDGSALPKPSEYLDFSNKRLVSAHPNDANLSVLQYAMIESGFDVYENEWWHFNDFSKY